MMSESFEDLVRRAEGASVEGWSFAWLDGRATEERPPWGYSALVVPRVEHAEALLDVQTGGAEVLVEILSRAKRAPTVTATESWLPNSEIARRNLARFGGRLAVVADADPLPFEDAVFDLVISRHPAFTRWDEISRVLAPGGSYLAQHVGPGSNRELTDFLMGPQQVSTARSPERAVREAAAHGLDVVDLRTATLRVAFHDIGAVVWFLRKVIWTVPGFSVDAYRRRLEDLHEHIEKEGSFVCHSQRFLIELAKT